MSKKAIIIVIVVSSLFLVGGLYARSLFLSSQEVLNNESEFSIEKSATLDLPTSVDTEKVTVPNVFRPIEGEAPIQIVKDETSGSTTATLRDTEEYSIYGFSGMDGSSFMLSLHGVNLRQARLNGEKDLLALLSITEEQACATGSITVIIESPYDRVTPERYVGLSFCPNRVDLPERVEIELDGSTNNIQE